MAPRKLKTLDSALLFIVAKSINSIDKLPPSASFLYHERGSRLAGFTKPAFTLETQTIYI